MRTVVERDIHPEFGARIQQSLSVGILANYPSRRIGRNAVRTRCQLRPGLAVVVGPVNVRREIAELEPQDRNIGCAGAVGRGLDRLDAAARRQVRRRDVRPGLAVVSGYVDGSVIGPHPDEASLKWRFLHGVKRAIELLAGYVASDRTAGHHLRLGSVSGQVR